MNETLFAAEAGRGCIRKTLPNLSGVPISQDNMFTLTGQDE
jgi:hypothetical protein